MAHLGGVMHPSPSRSRIRPCSVALPPSRLLRPPLHGSLCSPHCNLSKPVCLMPSPNLLPTAGLCDKMPPALSLSSTHAYHLDDASRPLGQLLEAPVAAPVDEFSLASENAQSSHSGAWAGARSRPGPVLQQFSPTQAAVHFEQALPSSSSMSRTFAGGHAALNAPLSPSPPSLPPPAGHVAAPVSQQTARSRCNPGGPGHPRSPHGPPTSAAGHLCLPVDLLSKAPGGADKGEEALFASAYGRALTLNMPQITCMSDVDALRDKVAEALVPNLASAVGRGKGGSQDGAKTRQEQNREAAARSRRRVKLEQAGHRATIEALLAEVASLRGKLATTGSQQAPPHAYSGHGSSSAKRSRVGTGVLASVLVLFCVTLGCSVSPFPIQSPTMSVRNASRHLTQLPLQAPSLGTAARQGLLPPSPPPAPPVEEPPPSWPPRRALPASEGFGVPPADDYRDDYGVPYRRPGEPPLSAPPTSPAVQAFIEPFYERVLGWAWAHLQYGCVTLEDLTTAAWVVQQFDPEQEEGALEGGFHTRFMTCVESSLYHRYKECLQPRDVTQCLLRASQPLRRGPRSAQSLPSQNQMALSTSQSNTTASANPAGHPNSTALVTGNRTDGTTGTTRADSSSKGSALTQKQPTLRALPLAEGGSNFTELSPGARKDVINRLYPLEPNLAGWVARADKLTDPMLASWLAVSDHQLVLGSKLHQMMASTEWARNGAPLPLVLSAMYAIMQTEQSYPHPHSL
eukprot:gene12615-2304_t